MCHPMHELRAVRPLAKLLLLAAMAAFLVLATSASTRAAEVNQVAFQASYQGDFIPQLADDGTIVTTSLMGMLGGDATFLPDSQFYFGQSTDPADPTVLTGAFVLLGGDNGSALGLYQGTQTLPDDSGVVVFSGTYNLLGGTVQGIGPAVGSGAISGVMNLHTGDIAITLIGTLSPATPTPE